MAFNWTSIKTIQDAFASLVNNEFLADVRFQFRDGPSLFAHSFILSLRSQQFYDNFHGTVGMMKFIEIDDVSYEIFSEFLKFFYTDSIDLNPSNIVEMTKLSIKYKINILSMDDNCEKDEEIMEDMTIDRACGTLQDAVQKQSNEVQKLTQEFIADHYLTVLNSYSFLDVNETTLKIILELDPVSDVNEFKIFESVINWTTRSCEKDRIVPCGNIRRIKLGDNLKLIRFGAMTFDEFVKCHDLAPGLLTDNEVAAIFLNIGTKITNSLGFSDHERRVKPRKPDVLTRRDEIALHFAPKFNWITFQSKELEETFFIEFTVSKPILFMRARFYFKTDVEMLQYRILKNDKIIQTYEKKLDRVNYKVQGMNIEPITLHPERRYRFEYAFKNLTSESLVRADKYELSEFQKKLSEEEYVSFMIKRSHSHLKDFKFKC